MTSIPGALPPTIDVPRACELLSISTWMGYELVKRGEFPVRVLRLGRAIRIPTQPLLELLGVPEPHVVVQGLDDPTEPA